MGIFPCRVLFNSYVTLFNAVAHIKRRASVFFHLLLLSSMLKMRMQFLRLIVVCRRRRRCRCHHRHRSRIHYGRIVRLQCQWSLWSYQATAATRTYSQLMKFTVRFLVHCTGVISICTYTGRVHMYVCTFLLSPSRLRWPVSVWKASRSRRPDEKTRSVTSWFRFFMKSVYLRSFAEEVG